MPLKEERKVEANGKRVGQTLGAEWWEVRIWGIVRSLNQKEGRIKKLYENLESSSPRGKIRGDCGVQATASMRGRLELEI